MIVVAVRVVGRVAERPADGVSVVPVPIGTRRPPADVVVARPRPPRDPRARVRAPRDPRPAMTAHIDPAPVVKWRPAPRVVGDPDVAGVLGVRPVARRRVRNEVGSDLGLGRNPDRAVRRVVDPYAVPVEGRLELGERAGIGIGVLVRVRADGDLAVGACLGRGLRARLELLRRGRLGVGLTNGGNIAGGDTRLGLVARSGATADRERTDGHEGNGGHDLRRSVPTPAHRLASSPAWWLHRSWCNRRAASQGSTNRRKNQGCLQRSKGAAEVNRAMPTRRFRRFVPLATRMPTHAITAT